VALLIMLLPFLQRVIDLSDANKMTVSNIGVVFGPTLLPQRTSGLDVMGCAHLFTHPSVLSVPLVIQM
jgi:hypothetical protein